VFAPGGTNVPITPSVGQANGESTESGIPLCSALPTNYGYASRYSGPGNTMCNKPCDVPANSLCPGFQPPAASFAVAFPAQPPHLLGLVISTRKAAAATMVSFAGGNEGFWRLSLGADRTP
jgi:hypothetical protein